MAFKEETLVLPRVSLLVGFQELVEEVAAGRGHWGRRAHWTAVMVGVSARIGVDLCPLKLSGLGGLRAPFPGMTTPCILKGPVLAGMLRASRAAAVTLQNLVTLWLIYLALEEKETLRNTYCVSLCLA